MCELALAHAVPVEDDGLRRVYLLVLLLVVILVVSQRGLVQPQLASNKSKLAMFNTTYDHHRLQVLDYLRPRGLDVRVGRHPADRWVDGRDEPRHRRPRGGSGPGVPHIRTYVGVS